MMSDEIRDSLRCWQKEGFGIAIHGYNHDDWREWDYKEVFSDINACERWLTDMGFNIYEIRYVVPPHGSNNMAIRKAIKDKEYQMVMGANMINPDTTVFQMGRVFISRDTNIEEIVDLLKRAKKRNCYVIFGSHSSIPEEFALEKTKAILSIAIKMGFNI